MIHEFIEIIQSYKAAKKNNLRSVIATVVDLDGSSYRKPGVRMLIHENGHMTGAVSGGCVENEILKQSYTVFKSGEAKVISYDGRYRLGCEGVLYILIDRFEPSEELLLSFEKSFENREVIVINSFFKKELISNPDFGSVITFESGRPFTFYKKYLPSEEVYEDLKIFTQKLDPLFRLIIVGVEHDAAQLSKQAGFMGWEVILVAGPSNSKELKNFKGADRILHISSNDFDLNLIDNHTAILLMTHNYAKDLQFLTRFKESFPAYIGLLGASSRRERLLNEFIEINQEVDTNFLDQIYAPTGLNIGAISAQEIALSICAEILSVIRKATPKPLKNLSGRIHPIMSE